jgi:hypothetical protein
MTEAYVDDALYDASDEEHVKAAQKVQDDVDKDIDYMLSKPRGRRWLYRMAYEQCHCDRQSHVPGDPESSAYNEGARAIGLSILEDVRRRSPNAYMKMLEENHFDE